MFKKTLFVILFFFSILFFTHNTLAKPNIKAGLWKFTVQMDMPGMPYKIPPSSSEKCITDNDLTPKTDSPDQSCQIKNQKISGNTITYDINCEMEGSSTKGNAKITYTGSKMTGKMDITVNPGNQKMVNNITGTYIGSCPK